MDIVATPGEEKTRLREVQFHAPGHAAKAGAGQDFSLGFFVFKASVFCSHSWLGCDTYIFYFLLNSCMRWHLLNRNSNIAVILIKAQVKILTLT